MRIVLKLGTSTLTHPTGNLNIRRVEELCKVCSDLKNAGHELVLVSSGAVAMGVGKLSLAERPKDIPGKQAAAAVGQCELMYIYDKLFSQYHHVVAQLLITADDIETPERAKNFQNTLTRLLQLRTLPIINENDTVATQELGIGDNDTLAAIVARTIRADLLILFSDIDGLFTADPHSDPAAKLIPVVERLTPEIERLACGGQQIRHGRHADEAPRRAHRHGGRRAHGHCQRRAARCALRSDGRQARRHKISGTGGEGIMEFTPTEVILQRAKAAAACPALRDTEAKNRALAAMAQELRAEAPAILAENAADLEASRGKVSDVMLDRLALNEARLEGMAAGIEAVAALPDPVGRTLDEFVRPDGLRICKRSVPMGVIAIIYESRPNVTSDAAALALKSGNVCVLRSGREAYRSAAAITAALRRGLERTGLTPDLVNLVEDTSHAGAAALMTATGYVDLLIPRGGAGLIRACVEHATVPCIQTGTGICHIYVDESADLDMALDIIENAKTSRPSVCNAAEVLLVHRAAAPSFLPMLQKRLCGPGAKHPVRLRCDGEAAAILGIAPDPEFDTEFLDYVLAVGVVDDVEGAIRHIAQHSTHHSEAIVTQSEENAARFTAGVDSAAVYVNASTRFTDGGEFGLGCEMGISTQKLHARGPIGLNELTTYQYVITGNGQIRR